MVLGTITLTERRGHRKENLKLRLQSLRTGGFCLHEKVLEFREVVSRECTDFGPNLGGLWVIVRLALNAGMLHYQTPPES